MKNMATRNALLLLFCMIVPSTPFTSKVRQPLKTTKQPTTSLFSAMERLHDTSTNAFGSIEHVYSLSDIDYVTRKIAEDEWMALGTAIAEAMYEMILDVGDEALHEMGFVERMSVTDKIAEDVTSAVEVSEVCMLCTRYAFQYLIPINNILPEPC